MLNAEDLGEYFRVHVIIEILWQILQWMIKLNTVEEYNSHNTKRLDVEGMKELLKKLDLLYRRLFMKVLVTWSRVFIVKNLISHLQEKTDIELITFDIEDEFSKIENNINKIDFIFHLAGVNRPQSPEEFYNGNTDLTKKIVDLIKDKNIPILITSSIQAEKDNDYGKSKKISRRLYWK